MGKHAASEKSWLHGGKPHGGPDRSITEEGREGKEKGGKEQGNRENCSGELVDTFVYVFFVIEYLSLFHQVIEGVFIDAFVGLRGVGVLYVFCQLLEGVLIYVGSGIVRGFWGVAAVEGVQRRGID